VAKVLAGPKAKCLETGKPVRELISLDAKGMAGSYDFRVQPVLSSKGDVEGIACVLSREMETS
jgi:hypothetical protein